MSKDQHINELKRVIASLEKELDSAHSDIRTMLNMLEDHQQIFTQSMRDKYTKP